MAFDFGRSETRAALVDLLSTLERSPQLAEAQAEAGNSMTLRMQLVFPVAAKIQSEVVAKYGFSGPVHFVQCVKQYERDDAEIARLYGGVKRFMIPPLEG